MMKEEVPEQMMKMKTMMVTRKLQRMSLLDVTVQTDLDHLVEGCPFYYTSPLSN